MLIDEGEKLLPLLRLTTSGGNIKEGEKLLPLLTSGSGANNIKSSPEQTTGSGSGSPSKTTSEPPNKVFGIDKDAKEIIRMLHDDKAADHSVIGIHGMSGSGKSTLAQYVCECEKNSEIPHFELIMWIHVTQKFSVDTIYKEMIEIVPGEKMEGDTNLDKLKSELKKRLQGKRLLLVLDDVWYSENVREQDDQVELLSPLKESDKASRVLFTSRTADTAKLLGAARRNNIEISDMDVEESFKMFMHHAFDNSGVSEEDRGEFDTLGRDISKLLRKSPMAAKTVGRQLKRRTSEKKHIEYWKDILIHKHDLLKHTMGALWWSYNQLEEHVQQCFAYCSMFPTRYELKREELVKMWMAQGLVDTSKHSDIEVAARECFDILLSTSFIQPHKTPAGREYYTVHDLLHDLAGRVAGSDCFTIEKDMVEIPQDVRHLFIDSNNLGELIEQIVKLETLRTVVMSSSFTTITAKEFERMLNDLKKLRFVSVWLEKTGANVIPECIGKLKHLRYLGLHGSSFEGALVLPAEFTKLYYLQELFVPFASEVCCLNSTDMADLENLRRIRAVSVSIPDIGRMPWLQTLGGFNVKKEKGYEITQLENLNNIHGELNIYGLGNIQSKEEARRANLSSKLHVSDLHLDWRSYGDEGTESSSRKKQKTAAGHHQEEVTPEPEEILEALHPPVLLKELWIDYYGGSTFPSWLSGEEGNLEHLEILTFDCCHGSGSQLKFSEPLPKLHRLNIKKCSWNALPDNIEQLASLKKFLIDGCTNIQSLPGLPSSLEKLEIWNCSNMQSLQGLPSSLKKLEIVNCPNIQSLPGLPSSLKLLRIEDCPNICTLPELPPSLEELEVVDCSKIKSLPGLPSSL